MHSGNGQTSSLDAMIRKEGLMRMEEEKCRGSSTRKL